MFSSHMQHLAAGRKDLELEASGQQVYHRLCCTNYLLKVVQQEQQLLLPQVLLETFQERLARSLADAERLCDSGHDQRAVADGGKVHEKHAVGKEVGEF